MTKENEKLAKKINKRLKIGRWAFSGAETCGMIAERSAYVLAITLASGAALCFVSDMCQRSINKIKKNNQKK